MGFGRMLRDQPILDLYDETVIEKMLYTTRFLEKYKLIINLKCILQLTGNIALNR